jgi:ribosome biogenesis GTPase
VNRLAGADLMATGAVHRSGKGRHTTTHRQLVLLPGGGLLIDTPGMRALAVVDAEEGVRQAFDDVERLAEGCGYTNCAHAGEERCAVAEAVADGRLAADRLEGWRRLSAEPAWPGYPASRRAVEERKRRKATKRADRRTSGP